MKDVSGEGQCLWMCAEQEEWNKITSQLICRIHGMEKVREWTLGLYKGVRECMGK